MQNKKFHKTLLIAALSLAALCTDAGYGSMYVNAGEIMQQDAGDEWADDSQEWNLDANGTLTITGTGNLSTWYWDEFDAKSSDVKKMIVNVTGMTFLWLDSDDFPNLESIDLSRCDGSEITDLSAAFAQLTKLKTVNFGNFNTSNVTDMRGMFSGCRNLSSLDLKGFHTGNVTDIEFMFNECNALKEIDISNFDLSNIELERENTGETFPIYLFGQTDNLEKIKLPANLPERIVFPYSELIPDNMIEYWKDESGGECEYAKAGLSVPMTYTRALREIYTPAPPVNPAPTALPVGTQVTDVASSGKFTVTGSDTVVYAGTANTYAKSINIPDSITYLNVTYKVTSVNAKALRANKQVTSVKVGANVTKIGNNAFENCTKLKSVTVGKEREGYKIESEL